MCVYLSCLAALLTLLPMVSPLHAETKDGPGHFEGLLCRFVRAAASEVQLEETVRARLQEGEVFSTLDLHPRSPLLLEKSSLPNNSNIRADRELFESSLNNRSSSVACSLAAEAGEMNRQYLPPFSGSSVRRSAGLLLP